ncbi:MAG: flagellar filament capping protein FliD [Sandaracinaceae bacterium]
MAGGITFNGLATGLDTASIISQLMQIERQPITRLEDKKATNNTKVSKLRSLQTKLTALSKAAEKLGDRPTVLGTKVSSSSESVFTAKALGGAPVGPSSVHVTRLAKAEKTYSDAFTAKDQTGLFGSGTLTIAVGSEDPVDITVEATDTLESIATKINSSGASVTAGVLFDGTTYRLRVSGDETGANHAIEFTESGTSLGLDDPANEVTAAQDAELEIDGFSMTRHTNTVSDAISGVTLTLKGESPTATADTLLVERDSDGLKSNVDAFVAAYNDVMKTINAEFSYTAGVAKSASTLSGDATLRSIQGRLRGRVASALGGASGPFTTLASLGIKSANDGTLSVDSTKLEAALASDSDAVADFFSGDSGAGLTGMMSFFVDDVDVYNASTDGALVSKISGLEGRSKDIDKQIDSLELRLTKTEENLTRQYSSLEQIVSGLTNQGNQILSVLSGLNNR